VSTDTTHISGYSTCSSNTVLTVVTPFCQKDFDFEDKFQNEEREGKRERELQSFKIIQRKVKN
jgi:hypothetical protein